MRWIYQYPDIHGTEADMLDPGPIDEVARAAEDAGFDGFSLTEHPSPGAKWLDAGGHQSLDPFVGLAYAAAATKRLRLLTYLCVVPYRNPLLLAKSAATVDKLSGGRLILGIGTGYLKREFHALGVDFEERNALFDEALEAMTLYWKGDSFSFKGLHFEAREVIGRPRPVQDPIPIWIGGNSQLTRRRVAEKGHGWMPLLLGPEMLSTVRTPPLADLDHVARAVAEMREVAHQRGASLDLLYPYSEPSLFDDPGHGIAKHREAIERLAEAGVSWIVVSSKSRTTSDTLRFVESFGANYIQP